MTVYVPGTKVTISVLGTPAPKGSARAMMVGGHARVIASGSSVNQRKIKAWATAVRERALLLYGDGRTDPVFVGLPLAVTIAFRMARPMGHWGKGKNAGTLNAKANVAPMTKPDIDKLVRATLDALTGLVFDDDSRISQLTATKTWAMPGHEGASITVEAAS